MIPVHKGLLLEHEYHVIEVIDQPNNLYECLEDWFGPAGYRWFMVHNKIYFRDSRDYVWFELKT